MGSGTFYPAVSLDNGMIRSDDSYTAGGIYFYIGLSGTYRSIWVRFPNVTIPQGATITTCLFKLTSQQGNAGTVEWNAYFNDHDDAVSPSSKADYDSKDVTTAVAWDTSTTWVDETQYDSPELKTILQTVVDRAGFASGQAVMVLLQDDGSAAYREIATLYTDAEKPELYVEWAEPAVLVPAGADQLQTVDNVALTQNHVLTMQGADQLQAVDGDLVLIVNLLKNISGDQLQTVDNIVLTQKHLLVVQGADQVQTVDGALVLTQKHTLTMQGADQLQVADNVGSLFILAMQGADQLQTVDNISVNLHLAPAGADQLQVVDAFAITQKHTLATQGADQLQTVDTFYMEWPGWLTLYGKEATKYYYCTLTGAADSLADLIIPMSSFQARRKDGDPTFLSLVTPGTSQKTAIEARANGQMVITCKYVVTGQDDRSAEIMRVDYEEVREDSGSKNQSLTLLGHITDSYQAKTVTLLDPTYKRDDDGDLAYRCATPDPFLNPGDTAEYGSDSFTVKGVVYIIGTNNDGSVQASMEVQEVDA